MGEEYLYPIMIGQLGVPRLTEGQIRQALMVITVGYFILN